MDKIRAYVDMDERRGVHYWREFEIIDKLPEVGTEWRLAKVCEICEVWLDAEQGSDEVYDYDYYRVITEDDEGALESVYVAIKKEELKNE